GDFLTEFKEQLIVRATRVSDIAEAVISQSLIHEAAVAQVQAAPTEQEAMRLLFEALEREPPLNRVSFHLILRMTEPELIQEL
ncbi:hypothetical protein M9458_038033, partial [Cirrhinus mrigala]